LTFKYDSDDLAQDFEDFKNQKEKENKEIQAAKELAELSHQGQTRDEGTPYFEHVERVAQRLIDMRELSEYIIIAYLHDILEDTHITYDDLKEQFGIPVADGVQTLTKTRGADVNQYLKNIVNHKSYGLAYVKMLDRIDNVSSLSFCPSENKVKKYIKETQDIFIPTMSTGRQMKHSDYTALLNELNEKLEFIKKEINF